MDKRNISVNIESKSENSNKDFEIKYLIFGCIVGAAGYFIGGLAAASFIFLLLLVFLLFFKPSVGLIFFPFFIIFDFAVKSAGMGGLFGLWDEILFIVLFVILLIYKVRTAKEKLRFTSVIYPVVTFLIFAIISIILSNSVTIAQGIEAIRSVIQSFIFFFLVINTPMSKKEIRGFLFLVVLGGVVCALYGIYQYLVGVATPPNWVDKDLEFGLSRAFSFLGSPNAFSAYCVMIAPVALGFAFQPKLKASHKLFFWGLFLLLVGGLVSSLTRASWLAFIPALCLFMLMIKKGKYIFLVLIAVVITVIFVPPIQQRFSTLFSEQYQQKSASGGRTYRWSLALDLTRQKPFFGEGPGSYGGAVAYRYQEFNGLYSDNYYLEILSNYGFLGFIAFLFILILLLKNLTISFQNASKNDKILIAGVICGSVSLFINMYTENLWEIVPLSVVLWFMVACAIKLGDNND
ncbi:MAG: O-antigen ligase family protein [Caldisericia bacterium]|nr:O-antigen ligase family protein [Caldisericia bacterium]